MFFHLVQADVELPNDNPKLMDPCGVLALLQDVLDGFEAHPEQHEALVEPEAALPPAVHAANFAAPDDEEESSDVLSSEAPLRVPADEPRISGILEIAVRSEASSNGGDTEDDEEEIEIVDELPPVEFELDQTADSPSEVADDPFTTFVRTLVSVAEDAGCTRAAALLPALLADGQVDPSALGDATLDGLVGAGVLERGPSGIVSGEGLRRTASAWRAILRGDSDDFTACGPRMLDEWAADLVARLLAAPSKTDQLRRALRTRGIAAFGLVLAA